MESTPKRIIRGANIEGVSFLNPSNKAVPFPENPPDSLLKLHEILSKKQGCGEEQLAEIEEIWREAEKEGTNKGFQEGQKQGYAIGKEEGFHLGFKEGREQARQEMAHLMHLVNHVAMGLTTKQEGIFEQLKPEMIQFILKACEQVLRLELLNPEALIHLIERLLKEAQSIVKDTVVTVILAPVDFARLEQGLKTFIYNKEEIRKLNFISDKSIEQGNCRIETNLGLVNFDIKRILEDLEKKVLEVDV